MQIKTLAVTAAAAAASLLLVSEAASGVGPCAGLQKHFVSSSGTGYKVVKNDKVDFTLKVRGPKSKDKEVEQNCRGLRDAIEKNYNNITDMRMTFLQDMVYNYTTKTSTPGDFVGTIEFTSQALKEISAIMAETRKVTNASLESMGYKVSDESRSQAEKAALTSAVKDAKMRAEAVTEAIGANWKENVPFRTDITSSSTGTSTQSVSASAMATAKASASASAHSSAPQAAPPSVPSAGTQRISQSVKMQFCV